MIFIIVINIIFNCLTQNINGTNFSSAKPFYGQPPYQFKENVNYFISFKTDPSVIRALVPEPLAPISSTEITIVFAKHNVVAPKKLFYHEVYLLIPSAINNIVGGYMSLLYLNKVEGILQGRDIWVYNKVGTDIQFKEDGNNVTVRVS